MRPTLTRPRPAQRNLGGRLLIGAGVAVAALVGIVLMPGLRTSELVEQVTITNPSSYGLQVDVADAQRDGWLDLGTINRESARQLREILDQGSTWVFRFSYAGARAGEVEITRAQLRDGGWKLVIPDEVGDRLAAKGVRPSAY